MSENETALLLRELSAQVAQGQVDWVPLQQVLARGLGRLAHASDDCIYVDGIAGTDGCLWTSDPEYAAQVLASHPRPAMLEVTGTEAAHAAKQAFLGCEGPFEHLVCAYLEPQAPQVSGEFTVRPLTPDFAHTVLSHYSHPEFFDEEEVRRRLAAGIIDGGFVGDELVGFIGLHGEGSMGMLEVFPPYRRRGFARQLEAAKIASELELGHIPWGQVFPENSASIQLQRSLGLRFGHEFQAFMDCGTAE